MKPISTAARAITTLAKSKLVFYSSFLGLAMSFQVAMVSTPAHAYQAYAVQNGGVACTKCHTPAGYKTGNMKVFTAAGTYFKTNRRLPPKNKPKTTKNNGQGNNGNSRNNNNEGWNNNNNRNNNNEGWNNNNNRNNNNQGWNNNNNRNNNNQGWNNNNNRNNNNEGWNNNNNRNNNNEGWNNNNNRNNNNEGWNNNNNRNNNNEGQNSNNGNNNSQYSCGRGYRLQDNTDYRGNDLRGYRKGLSGCRQQCQIDDRCRGFSWIKTNAAKKCWLKRRMGRSSYKANVLSCVKQ